MHCRHDPPMPCRHQAQNRHAAAEHAAAADRAQPLGATALGFRRHSLSPADGEESTRRVPVAGAATGCTAATAEGRNANRHAAAERVVTADRLGWQRASQRARGERAPPTARGAAGPTEIGAGIATERTAATAAEHNASRHAAAEHAAVRGSAGSARRRGEEASASHRPQEGGGRAIRPNR